VDNSIPPNVSQGQSKNVGAVTKPLKENSPSDQSCFLNWILESKYSLTEGKVIQSKVSKTEQRVVLGGI
jgi:hypothetical protein